jgi:uncharacterized membrane protein
MEQRPSLTTMKKYIYYFLLGLIIVNIVALTGFDPWYIGALLSFIYVVTAPGLLLLPFLLKKKLAIPLGVVMSVALSILTLMLAGLSINTILPLMGIMTPLTTIPLLSAFDTVVLVLLVLAILGKKELAFEFRRLTGFSWRIIGVSVLLPILAILGTIMLNNNGSDAIAMLTLGTVLVLVPVLLANREKIDGVVPPIALFMMALTFLFMNSMRGWFITGHDIELEYHVFTLVNTAHLWSMSLYQDPYMACLSLTILPTYLQQLIQVNSAYIFKFFIQFIGALPVVAIYYLCKEYVSGSVAFLAGFLYITFPTFMTDMAFLNRQGIAFVFFSVMLFALLNTEYFTPASRVVAMFLFATGMVLSHYSTSYVAIAVLVAAYIVDRIARAIMKARWPRWFSRATDLIGNKQGYAAERLLTLPFVTGVFVIIILWSVVVTHTSSNLVTTIQQIGQNIVRPFSIEENTGIASYNILQTQTVSPPPATNPFQQFVETATQQAEGNRSEFYPLGLTTSYSTVVIPEPTVPLTPLGAALQSTLGHDLNDVFNDLKQLYAKIVQGLLLLGLMGLLIAYSFKKTLLKDPPVEYIALSIAGIIVLMGQTILPASAIDYGLLRLFQQNLIFLALPTVLTLIALAGIFTRNTKAQALICAVILLFFFFVLSGMFPQMTGGGRPPLTLDNYGFYYDAYYTHTQEIASLQWLAANAVPAVPVQSDRYFSNIKMITYAGIAPIAGLLPETIQKNAYIYLNYNNVVNGDVIEYLNGEVVYYKFPLNFLANTKNLIYNNGGSEIYR